MPRLYTVLLALLLAACVPPESTPSSLEDCLDVEPVDPVWADELTAQAQGVCTDPGANCSSDDVIRAEIAVCVTGFDADIVNIEVRYTSVGVSSIPIPAYWVQQTHNGTLTRKVRSETALVHGLTGELLEFNSVVFKPEKPQPQSEPPCCVDG